jgi:hypothetical protein
LVVDGTLRVTVATWRSEHPIRRDDRLNQISTNVVNNFIRRTGATLPIEHVEPPYVVARQPPGA